MKGLLLLFVCLMASAAFADLSEKAFEEKFHERFSDKADEAAAAKELANEEAEIREQNELYKEGKSTYDEKITELSDIPRDDEFASEKLGQLSYGTRSFGQFEVPKSKRFSPESEEYLAEFYDKMSREYVPSSYDSRYQGHVTPVKNQLNCGSCAAFAATAVHETCMLKAGAPHKGLDLSEQHLVDCGYDADYMNGCNGAFVHSYIEWFAKQGGQAPHEVKYPYLDRDPYLNCNKRAARQKWNSGAKVTKAIVDFNCDEEKMKKLVYKHGAVATGIFAGDTHFGNSNHGVFSSCSSKSINHAVTVVGYGNENGVDYWVVKNSWGEFWADKGYIKVRRGTNECGLAGFCVVSTCSNNGYSSPAPVAPPPAPIPASQLCDVTGIYKNLNGNYKLITDMNGKKYTSEVNCKDSVCSPKVAGPSNACMYICGKLKC